MPSPGLKTPLKGPFPEAFARLVPFGSRFSPVRGPGAVRGSPGKGMDAFFVAFQLLAKRPRDFRGCQVLSPGCSTWPCSGPAPGFTRLLDRRLGGLWSYSRNAGNMSIALAAFFMTARKKVRVMASTTIYGGLNEAKAQIFASLLNIH